MTHTFRYIHETSSMEAQIMCHSAIHFDTNNTKLQLLTIIQRVVGPEVLRIFTKLSV